MLCFAFIVFVCIFVVINFFIVSFDLTIAQYFEERFPLVLFGPAKKSKFQNEEFWKGLNVQVRFDSALRTTSWGAERGGGWRELKREFSVCAVV